jgi:zinc finger SWIM domain-containing protein 3
MAKAIAEVLPESCHRLCQWHLFQNALKHLKNYFRSLSSFAEEFKSCMRDHEFEDDFIQAWYMVGILFCKHTTRQLSESFNSRLRDYLKSTYNVMEFFRHFERVLDDLRYNELQSNYDMSQRLPVLKVEVLLLKNSRDVYTPKIFNLFQQEYKKSLDMVVNACHANSLLFENKVCMYGHTQEHNVIFNSIDQTVVCSCKKLSLLDM